MDYPLQPYPENPNCPPDDKVCEEAFKEAVRVVYEANHEFCTTNYRGSERAACLEQNNAARSVATG